jgi:uncharacterized membrane protein YdjX (TVP38/TMEM64 family)
MMKPDATTQPPHPDPAPRDRKGAAGGRSAHRDFLFSVGKNKRAIGTVLGLLLIVVLSVGLVLLYTDLRWSMVTEWIDGVNPLLALPLMAFLPIAGFPIAIVYLFAGARFGPLYGGVVVAVITAIHLAGTYLVTRSFLRAPLERWIARRHRHLPQIPEDEQAAVCVIAALVPGLPYFVRNYLLALGGVKLRYLFTVVLPVYVARSYVTILLGDMSADPHRNKIIFLVAIDVLKAGVCAYVIWRLREHHRRHHPDDHPRADPGALPPPNAAAK